MEENTRKMIPAVHVKEEPLWQNHCTSEAGLYDAVNNQLGPHEVEVKVELKSPAAARHETIQAEAQGELISFECSQTYAVGFTLGAHVKDVVIKEEFEPIKEEPEVTTSTCLAATRSGLYAGHKVKDELVLGPECLLKPNDAFLCDVLECEHVPYFEAPECIVNSATPHIEAEKCQDGATDPGALVCAAMKCMPECSVRLERLADHEAVLRAHGCRLASNQQLQVLTHVALNRVACGWASRPPPPPLPLRGWRPPTPPRPPHPGRATSSRRAPPRSAPLPETVGMQLQLIRKDEVAYCCLFPFPGIFPIQTGNIPGNGASLPASTTKTKKRINEPVERCVTPASTTKTKKRINEPVERCVTPASTTKTKKRINEPVERCVTPASTTKTKKRINEPVERCVTPASTTKTKKRINEPVERCVTPASTTKTKKRINEPVERCVTPASTTKTKKRINEPVERCVTPANTTKTKKRINEPVERCVTPANTTKTKKRINEPVERCVTPATTTTKTKKRKNVRCKCGWLKCNRKHQPRLACKTCRVKFHQISEFRTHKATAGCAAEGGSEVFGVKFVRGTFVVTCRKKSHVENETDPTQKSKKAKKRGQT